MRPCSSLEQDAALGFACLLRWFGRGFALGRQQFRIRWCGGWRFVLRWWFDWRPFSLWEPLGLFFELEHGGRRCWDLRTRVLQGYQTDKGNKVLKDLRIITLSEFFPTIKKVVTVEKAGGIYTPNPRGTFTLLPMHFYLISALSGLLIGLYSSTPNTITSIPTPISLMSVLSKALFGLCARFSVEDPFTPRSFSES